MRKQIKHPPHTHKHSHLAAVENWKGQKVSNAKIAFFFFFFLYVARKGPWIAIPALTTHPSSYTPQTPLQLNNILFAENPISFERRYPGWTGFAHFYIYIYIYAKRSTTNSHTGEAYPITLSRLLPDEDDEASPPAFPFSLSLYFPKQGRHDHQDDTPDNVKSRTVRASATEWKPEKTTTDSFTKKKRIIGFANKLAWYSSGIWGAFFGLGGRGVVLFLSQLVLWHLFMYLNRIARS